MSKRKAETLQDQQIVCKDCSGAFTFTVREQTAFAAKGFQAKVRCADCTKAKKVRHTRTTHARHTHCRRTADALQTHCRRTATAAQRTPASQVLTPRCACQELHGESTGGEGGKKTLTQTRCFNCGKKGHTSQDCAKPQGSTACFVCGSEDHQSRSCPKAPTAPSPAAARCFSCGGIGHLGKVL